MLCSRRSDVWISHLMKKKKDRPQHKPDGDPCKRCGLPARKHKKPRPWHTPIGDPCQICGQSAKRHRSGYIVPSKRVDRPFIGMDGEGQGNEVHKYTLLAAADEQGNSWHTYDSNGLATVTCLEFILSLPKDSVIVMYSFGYDLTKILEQLPNETLYKIFHQDGGNKKPVKWGQYSFFLQGKARFQVTKYGDDGKLIASRVVWDVFRFFSCSFVKALKNWKIGTPEEVAFIENMKSKRSAFEKLVPHSVFKYCVQECIFLAALVKKLVDAHDKIGLKIRSYYGAGSTGAAMLNLFNVKKHNRETPDMMKMPVAQAFFGGRFENSVIGPVHKPVYGKDISSAYPYQIRFLPCLDCGTWELTRSYQEMTRSSVALVRYAYVKEILSSWAPFPFRDKDGSIFYPSISGGGWVWRDEFLVGQKIWPNEIEFVEAWVYNTSCNHEPFEDIPKYYLERLRLGEEAAGIVLKLGMNSVYGKIAQSVGSCPYQCWIWAGLITSGTRAQLLELMSLHQSIDSCLMIATDGLFSTEDVIPPKPRDTGTFDSHKPLGAWTNKTYSNGIVAVRPGIYFALGTDQIYIEEAKGRGVGPKIIQEQWKSILDAWYAKEEKITLTNVYRFMGAKTSFSVRNRGKEHEVICRSPNYGRWVERPIEVHFDPRPKRDLGSNGNLLLRNAADQVSAPYVKVFTSIPVENAENHLLEQMQDEKSEQPDGDYIEPYSM